MSLAEMDGNAVLQRIRGLDPDSMTPMEALKLLYELKREAGDP